MSQKQRKGNSTIKHWKSGFFNFKPINDCPDFSKYRYEVEQPNADPLQDLTVDDCEKK